MADKRFEIKDCPKCGTKPTAVKWRDWWFIECCGYSANNPHFDLTVNKWNKHAGAAAEAAR